MALQVVVKPQPTTRPTGAHYVRHHHQSTQTSAVSTHALQHRARFASVLRHIPAAAEQMRLNRARRPAPSRTVFLLDWDDTCCATSYLERCGVMADLDTRLDEFAPQLARYLRLLEQRVLTLLKTAARLGTVLIVTNAGDGWVELSSSRFLPAVREFLVANQRHIKIVSARARYVHAFRTQPLQWKALTFADELRPLFATLPDRTPMHVVVLGDSIGDQYAAHAAANTLTADGLPLVLKVVKFLERPTIDQLCKELAVVLDHIYAMTVHTSAFDVSMYKDVGAASPTAAASAPSAAASVAQAHAAAHATMQHYQQPKVATPQHHPHHLTAQEVAAAQGETPVSAGGAAEAALGGVAPMATCAAAV